MPGKIRSCRPPQYRERVQRHHPDRQALIMCPSTLAELDRRLQKLEREVRAGAGSSHLGIPDNGSIGILAPFPQIPHKLAALIRPPFQLLIQTL